MLIIGHRGSQGTHPENTVASLRATIQADADMVEFDIRLTRDRVPVLSHNWLLNGTRKRELALVRRYTLAELQKRTAGSEHPITTLDTALKECYGKIYINVELKEVGSVTPALDVIKRYAKTKRGWDSILISSFRPLALRAVRQQIPHAALGMLHYRNSLGFIAWHRVLNLSAVGFHRLHVSSLAMDVAKRFELFTYAWTVNREEAARQLSMRGIDGIVTDYPALMVKKLKR